MKGITELMHLAAKAVAMGGGDLCADGHDWQSEGGRSCPVGECGCSQAVYRCARCGAYDYGKRGGPGAADCAATCMEGHRDLFKSSAQVTGEEK